jgi:3-oxoacyl-[acyl-carrier-protein] synthase-3
MSAFISAISYYLPETRVSNQDLVEQFPEWSVDKIAKKIGVMNRHTVT